MLTNTVGLGKRWTVNDALNWIAFRVEPLHAPDTAIPEFGPFASANVMGALIARVGRNPRTWPGPNGIEPDPIRFEDFESPPAYYFRTLVRRWVTKLGLPASELLDRWTADRERYLETVVRMEDQQAKLSAALLELNEAAASSKLIVYGRPAEDYRCKSRKPREVIPARYVDEIRSIDPWGSLRTHSLELEHLFDLPDEGPFYADVAFDISAVMSYWPKPQPAKLLVPSVAMVNKFWREYLAKHNDPDKHPKAAQQKLDADSWFNSQGYSGPSVKKLQALRGSPSTPEHWREKGRRLKTVR